MLIIAPDRDHRFHLARPMEHPRTSLPSAEAASALVCDHGLRPEEASKVLELSALLGPLTLLPAGSSVSHDPRRTGRRGH